MDYGEYPQRVTPPYKSKAEIQIARLLDRERIAFRYEHPLAVIDGSKTKIWYPDFSLSNYGMIIEYFGMNDDSGYRKRSEHKMQVYRENGIEGVFLTEESFRGDWPTRIIGQIEGILQGRLDRFYGSGRKADGGAQSIYERAPLRRP
ncbi:MAG TPA: hypothetical protein VLI39_09565 [Sedimentisphaerales bacterium]|nr:hypothetical protein [Sedimentisphaerales bacterium]